MADEEEQYDMVMVFKQDPRTGVFSEKSEQVLKKVIPAVGLNSIVMYFSVDKGEIYVLFKLSLDRAKIIADIKNYKCLANEVELLKRAEIGWPRDNDLGTPPIPPLNVDKDERPDITPYRPFEKIYLRYELENVYQTLYQEDPYTKCPFTHVQKLKILMNLMQDPEDEQGLNLKVEELIRPPSDGSDPTLLAMYPLHDAKVLKEIKEAILV